MKLDKEKIERRLTQKTKKIIDDVRIEKSVTSTNTILLSEIKNNPKKVVALFAETQTQGRGRLGRAWISPPYFNIYFSLSWYFNLPVAQLSELSILVAECIIQALKNVGITDNIHIKWPNDLMFENKKLAGILIETVSINKNETAVVMGVGLNVNLKNENQIDQPWTSLYQIVKKEQDRNHLATYLLNALCSVLVDV